MVNALTLPVPALARRAAPSAFPPPNVCAMVTACRVGRLLQLLQVKLGFEDDASFRFFHGPTLYAYVHACAGTNRAGERFPHGTRFIPCETGRIGFEKHQSYHFGLALTPDSTMTPKAWIQALQRGPRLKRGRAAPLADNVRLTAVEDLVGRQRLGPRAHAVWLEEEHLNAAARPLMGQTSLTVRFQSPLLILRTPVDGAISTSTSGCLYPRCSWRACNARYPSGFPRWRPWVTPLHAN